MKIGQRIKNIRRAEKISSKDVAKSLGISVSTYRTYENDYVTLPHKYVSPICAILRITPNILYGNIDAEFSTMFAYVLDNWNGDVVALINMMGAYAMQPKELRRDTSDLCIFNAEMSIEQGIADPRLAELVNIKQLKQAIERLYNE